MKAFFRRLYKIFCTKNGEDSKTAIILSLASFALLFLWVFQSLFAECKFGIWEVPEFSPGAAASVMTTLGAIYLVNHSSLVAIRDKKAVVVPKKTETVCIDDADDPEENKDV